MTETKDVSLNEEMMSRLLNFINKYYEENGTCPSLNKIKEETGMNLRTVKLVIWLLQKRGEVFIPDNGNRILTKNSFDKMFDESS